MTTLTPARPPAVVDWIDRRGFIVGGAATAALVLAACGDDDGGDASGANGNGDGDGGGTREVATDKGPVRVPADPRRVACADSFGAFAVVDLGVTSVGVSAPSYADTGERYAQALDGIHIRQVGDFTEPVVEQVAAAEPDLILRTIDTEDELYEQLSAVAPTAVASFQQLSLTEVASRVGEVLGREDRAQELVDECAAACDRIRGDHADLLVSIRWGFAMSTDAGT